MGYEEKNVVQPIHRAGGWDKNPGFQFLDMIG